MNARTNVTPAAPMLQLMSIPGRVNNDGTETPTTWCVYDHTAGRTAFGPCTLGECRTFMATANKRIAAGKPVRYC